MISRTGPCGSWTRGRVAPLCAATGIAMYTAARPMAVKTSADFPGFMFMGFPMSISLRQARQRPGALSDTLPVDTEQMQNAEEHVRCLLRVVGKHHVAVAFKRAVDGADQDHRNFHMCVPMRIPHVASFIYKDVIEDVAVAFGRALEFLNESGQMLDMIAVHFRVVCYVLRLVTVVRRPMPSAVESGLREACTRQVTTEHKRG